MASGGTDEVIKIYDLNKMAEVGELMEHADTVLSLAFVGDKYLISGGADEQLLLWRCKDWKLVSNLKGHKTGPVNSISVHPSGKLALTTSNDNSLRAWNLESCRPASRNRIKDARYLSLCIWSPSGMHYAVVANDLNVLFFDVENTNGLASAALQGKVKINALCFYDEGCLVVGYENGDVRVLRIAADDIEEICTWNCESRVRSVGQVSGKIVVGMSNGKILVYKLKKTKPVLVEELNSGKGSHVTCVVVAPQAISQETGDKKRKNHNEETLIKKKSKK